MNLDYDAIMMAALRGDAKVLADAVPTLIARIREVEAQRDAARSDEQKFRKDVIDVTEEVLREFPGSKLSSSITRDAT